MGSDNSGQQGNGGGAHGSSPGHPDELHQFDINFENVHNNNNNLNDDLNKNPLDRGPYFDISASKNVTALVGNTAYLNCRVKNLGNRTVSITKKAFIVNTNFCSNTNTFSGVLDTSQRSSFTDCRQNDLHIGSEIPECT